jgi:hypothetical protein
MLGFNSDNTVTSVNDILELVTYQTGIKMNMFTKEDIKSVKDTLPNKLTPLRGALKIHEIQVNSAGEVRAKQLPTDDTYSIVTLHANFSVMPNRLVTPSLVTDRVGDDSFHEENAEV